MSTAAFLILAVIMLAIGIPVGFTMASSSLLYLIMNGLNPAIVLQRLLSMVDSTPLLCVPFFLLAGELMNKGGIGKRLIHLARMAVGRFPGGLCYVTIVACTFMSAVTGAAIAVCAALGAILIPEMVKAGYKRDFSTAIVCAGATLGPIIPPSISLVVFGSRTGTSVASLYKCGFPQGVIIAIVFAVYTYIIAKKRGYTTAPITKYKDLTIEEKTERRKLLRSSIWSIGTPVIILGGIFAGICTPTEASVVASLYSLIVAVFIYKEVKIKEIPKMMFDATSATARILFIISAAGLFSWVISVTKLPSTILTQLAALTTSPALVIALTVVTATVLGMFIDAGSISLITLPIFIPLWQHFQLDFVWVGTWLTSLYCLGTITPPFGTVLFTGVHVGKVSFQKLAPQLIPFSVVMFLAIMLTVFFPGLVMWAK